MMRWGEQEPCHRARRLQEAGDRPIGARVAAASTGEVAPAPGGRYGRRTVIDEGAAMNRKVWRPVVEVAFIMFLFYANLLMGEFERANSAEGKRVIDALVDIFTATNFVIGVLASLVGYIVVEFLRAKL
jgi:hypothetical protein